MTNETIWEYGSIPRKKVSNPLKVILTYRISMLKWARKMQKAAHGSILTG